MLQGAKLAGGNPKNDSVEYDFYATDPKAVEKLLLKYPINGDKILEPCAGNCTVDKDGKYIAHGVDESRTTIAYHQLCDLAHVQYNTSYGELFKALNTVSYSDDYKSNPNRAERRGKK